MYEFYLSRTRTTLSVIRLNVYCASRTIMHRFRSARATIPFRAYCMYTGEKFRLMRSRIVNNFRPLRENFDPKYIERRGMF